MGAPGPDELRAGGGREPSDATVAEPLMASHTPDAAPPPSYRLGSADVRPQPVSRLRQVLSLVVLIVLVVGALTFEVVQWRNQRALRSATAAANREAEQVAEAMTREEQAAIEREAARRQQLQAQDDARRHQLAEHQQAEQDALDESRAREQARESAWAAYYRPTPGCRDSTSVQCANAYIKARRDFDAHYAATLASSAPAR
ncbi:MAG TPA: hypothetical protein VMU47_21690 [Caldimonas sp.]|nr:hypothetical protein [Caldimonas sp.]